jgi:hypothetical protein
VGGERPRRPRLEYAWCRPAKHGRRGSTSDGFPRREPCPTQLHCGLRFLRERHHVRLTTWWTHRPWFSSPMTAKPAATPRTSRSHEERRNGPAIRHRRRVCAAVLPGAQSRHAACGCGARRLSSARKAMTSTIVSLVRGSAIPSRHSLQRTRVRVSSASTSTPSISAPLAAWLAVAHSRTSAFSSAISRT